MPLRFDLGPFEKLFIGKSVLTNNSDRTMFIVEGDTPILRARDVLTPERAINAAEKLHHIGVVGRQGSLQTCTD